MLQLIKEFPAQLLKAIEIGERVLLKTKFNTEIRNVVVAGLGGSGIGGNLLAELLHDELQIPIIVNKGYFLPACADTSTLLILSSYSGNTEEIVSCAEQAVEKGLHPVCITSGGKLEALAVKQQFDLIKIPAGFPPRCCLGYSATQLFFTLFHFNLISEEFKSSIMRTASFIDLEQRKIKEEAEVLADQLLRKILIVYAEDKYESAALRLKQQINENSKMHCWYNIVPEMNHNELVSWRESYEAIAVLILRTADEHNRNTIRMNFIKGEIAKVSSNIHEIIARGTDTFEKHFYLIHFGDWLSYHLALLQGYDPMEIEVLNKLKSHLNAVN